MNLKKFISGVSALTIAASAFAGMAVTANADGDPIELLKQNFNGYTAGAAGAEWYAGLGSGAVHGTRSYVADGENIYFSHTSTTSATRIAQFLLTDNESGIALNGAPVTVSFKARTSVVASETSASTSGVNYSLIDTAGNVILGVAFTDTGIAYYKGGASSKVDNSNSGNWGVDTNFGSRTAIENSTFSDNTWYDVTIAFDPTAKTAALSVTSGETTVASTTVEDLTLSVPMQYLHQSVGRLSATNSARLSGSPVGCVDDIYITQENVTIATANVTFSGNATSVVVGTDTVTAEGLDLVPDTYSYVAKADGLQSEYGTFTVTSEDAANGSKVVNVTLATIPSAPANTNSTVEKVSDNTSFIPDGFRNTSSNYSSGIEVWQGDTVTIEYDVFVTGGNKFNLTLKSANNGTGANVELIADGDTVTARNQVTGSSYNTFTGSYPVNQWAHVVISFIAAAPSVDGPPSTDIRTSNVNATITAADGSVITANDITARNIAPGFGAGSGTSYSFARVDVSGTANIANAEIYAVGDHTIAPTAVATLVQDNITDDEGYDEADKGAVYSVFEATVTAGTNAITNVQFTLNDGAMSTDTWSNGIIASGEAVFALIVPMASSEVTDITAVIDNVPYVAFN